MTMAQTNTVFMIPGDLNTPTGGYAYDKKLLEYLPQLGHAVTHLQLGDSFPHPTSDDAHHAAEQLQTVPPTSVMLVDGLALGALDPTALRTAQAPIIALIHHPLAYEGDLGDIRRKELYRTEKENLSLSDRVIVTSASTATLLHDAYGVPRSHITVARPGTNHPTLPPTPQDPPLILSVGSLSPRKGHDVLIRALGSVRDLRWQAVIAGMARNSAFTDSLRALTREHELENRLQLIGSVPPPELTTLYSQASIFALATRFEGYGMVFDEAMAAGLPIVSCVTGAVPDTVAPGAGLLVPTDDHLAFSEALRSLLTDEATRVSAAAASRQAGQALPTWRHTAQVVGNVLNLAHVETINE